MEKTVDEITKEITDYITQQYGLVPPRASIQGVALSLVVRMKRSRNLSEFARLSKELKKQGIKVTLLQKIVEE